MENKALSKPSLELSYHRPDWVFEYTNTVKEIRKLLPANIKVCFMHVGSTAVRGLRCRPIIDIAVGVINLLDLVTVRDILDNHGYKFNSSRSQIYDLFLEKRAIGKQRFNIHVVEFDGKRWKEMYDYTEFLKANPSVCKDFGNFKTDLVLKKKVSYEQYEKEKAKYIAEVMKNAK